jgi:DNA-binding response OmpR family regulator
VDDRRAGGRFVPAGRKHILLVEEEPALLDITSFRLELLGYQVQTHTTADSALDWLARNVPDLIAVGYLSDMDPVELLNRISDDPRVSDTPLLFLSANSDLDEVQRAYNAGADEYLLTPYDPLVLERKVEGLLEAADAQHSA